MPEKVVVDRGLQQDSSQLASCGKVVPGLDARLVLIDADNGIDKFHVLQGLEDPGLEDGPERYFCFQRYGDTGGRGSSKLDGPTVLPKVEAMIGQVFLEKTGQAWGTVQPGQVAKDGKYWLQQIMKPDSRARWEYFVNDGVDRKKEGWYPYTPNATEEVEELYAQHVADNCGKRTATRIVKSGHFSYKVDLTKMCQENTRTHTVRQIRRVFGAAFARRKRTSGSRATASRKTATRNAPMKRAATTSTKVTKAMKGSKTLKITKAHRKRAPAPAPVEQADLTWPKRPTGRTKVATGRYRRSQVFKGTRDMTGGGMRKEDFIVNIRGRVVSKKRSAVAGKQLWPKAVRQARLELGFNGFQPLGGKTEEGRLFLDKAKNYYTLYKSQELEGAPPRPAVQKIEELKAEQIEAAKEIAPADAAPSQQVQKTENQAETEKQAETAKEKARTSDAENKEEKSSTKVEQCTDEGRVQEEPDRKSVV